MNIFVVNRDPWLAAKDLCDKHVVKMIVESAQMLSTAHRVLDGKPTTALSRTGRRIKQWDHPNPAFDKVLCKATMVNHPCTRWAMENNKNYFWLYDHLDALLREYTDRYQKHHSMEGLTYNFLRSAPRNIAMVNGTTSFAQAMPDQYRNPDAITAYRNYYMGEKRRFAAWKTGIKPKWWKEDSQ